MGVDVAAVVDHDVERAVPTCEVVQESLVGLVAAMDVDPWLVDPFLLDVEPVDLAPAKVVPPHAQRRTTPREGVVAADADLQQPDRTAAELSEVLLVVPGVGVKPALVRQVDAGQRGQVSPYGRGQRPLDPDDPMITDSDADLGPHAAHRATL